MFLLKKVSCYFQYVGTLEGKKLEPHKIITKFGMYIICTDTMFNLTLYSIS